MDTTTPVPPHGPTPPGEPPAPGAPGGPGGPGTPRRGADGFFDSLYRVGIQRSDDRWVGGVAGGVARRLGVDPALVRGVWVVASLVAGAGLVLYALGWAFLPDARNQRILVRDAAHGTFDVALLGCIALFVVGVNWRLGPFGWWHAPGWIAGIFWLSLLAALAVLVAALAGGRYARQGPVPPPGDPAPPVAPFTAPSAAPFTAPSATPFTAPSATPGDPAPPVAPFTAPSATPFTAPSATPGAAADAPAGETSPTATYPIHPTYPTAAYPSATYPIHPTYPSPTYPATPGTSAGPSGPAGPVPPTLTPGSTRPRPAGPTTIGLVLGASLIAGAVVLGLDSAGHDVGVPWLTWGGVTLVLLGLGIVVAAFRGRRSGGLTALAIIAALVLVPAAAAQHALFDGRTRGIAPSSTVHVTDVARAQEGFRYAVGDLRLDLTDLPLLAGADPVVVPVRLGAGTTRIEVPTGVEVSADVQLFGGSVTWDVGGDRTVRDGVRRDTEVFTTPGFAATDGPRLVLDVVGGAGDITIEEQS